MGFDELSAYVMVPLPEFHIKVNENKRPDVSGNELAVFNT